MSYRVVEPIRGLEWIKTAFGLEFRNPMVFLVCGIIALLIFCVPAALYAGGVVLGTVGQLIIAFLFPILSAGFLQMFRTTDQGGTAEIGQMFWGFQAPGMLPKLAMLGIPSAASAVLSFVLGYILPAGMVSLLGFLIGLAVFGLVFFAVPRVTFDNIDPIEAFKESISASLANIIPLLVYFAIAIAACVVLAIVVFVLMFIPLLGQLLIVLIGLVLGVVLIPWGSGLAYAAYQDVFGGAAAPPPAPM